MNKILIIICLIFLNKFAFTAEVGKDLGLEGGNFHKLNCNNDGTFVLAALQGPKGIFYSTDFGNSWIYASGGDYEYGEGKDVLFVSNQKALMVAGSDLYIANPFTENPNWIKQDFNQDDAPPDSPRALAFDNGNFYLVGTGTGTIRVYNASTDQLISESQLPSASLSSDQWEVFGIAIDTVNGYIFACTGNPLGSANIYRASYNTTTGDIGSWSEKEPTTAKDYYAGIFIDNNQHLYVTTMNAPTQSENGLYTSTDHGDTYTHVNLESGPATNLNAHFFSQSNQSILIGLYFSSDGGTKWNELLAIQTATGANLNANAGIIHPSNNSLAIIASDIGSAKTSDLENGTTSTWTDNNSGLAGMIFWDMAQVNDNSNIVAIASKSGLAYTENYTDDNPVWNYPVFAGGDGSPHRQVIFDPNNNHRIFIGTNRIYEGAISSLNNISWQTLTNTENFMNITNLNLLSNNTFSCSYAQTEQAVDGKVQIWSLETTPAQLVTTFLSGTPVSCFLELIDSNNNPVYIAGAGVQGPLDDLDTAENNGIFYSNDSGNTWKHISLSEENQICRITNFVYDQKNDFLYMYGEKIFDDSLNSKGFFAEEDSGQNDQSGPPDSGIVYIVSQASEKFENGNISQDDFKKPSNGLNLSVEPSAMAIDPNSGELFMSVSNLIYQGFDHGKSWTVYYEGLPEEATGMLYFTKAQDTSDNMTFVRRKSRFKKQKGNLVQGSDVSIQELEGSGLPIVKKVKIEKPGNKLYGNKWIKIYFNISMKKKTNKVHVLMKETKEEIPINVEFSDNGKYLEITPIGLWPEGKLMIVIDKNLKTKDRSSKLDGNFSGKKGGKFKKKVKSI